MAVMGYLVRKFCADWTNMKPGENIYREAFPIGSKVRTKNRRFLEDFLKTWKFHNKLTQNQLNYAEHVTEVESVGFYHGGDDLYRLKGVPGVWHRQCLERPAPSL
jgi:hypothetical protein